MVRSNWIGPVALVLATSSLALGQDAGSDSHPLPPSDKIVQLQEVGRAPLACKLLKSWHEADGSRAFVVQALDTHEMISIYEAKSPANGSVAASAANQVQSRIVHWGAENHPPPGVPIPPRDALVHGSPLPAMTADAVFPPRSADSMRSFASLQAPAGGWPTAFAHEPPKYRPTEQAAQQALQTPQAQAPRAMPSARWQMTRAEEQNDKPATQMQVQTQPTRAIAPQPVGTPWPPPLSPADEKKSAHANASKVLKTDSSTWPTAVPLKGGTEAPTVSTWSAAQTATPTTTSKASEVKSSASVVAPAPAAAVKVSENKNATPVRVPAPTNAVRIPENKSAAPVPVPAPPTAVKLPENKSAAPVPVPVPAPAVVVKMPEAKTTSPVPAAPPVPAPSSYAMLPQVSVAAPAPAPAPVSVIKLPDTKSAAPLPAAYVSSANSSQKVESLPVVQTGAAPTPAPSPAPAAGDWRQAWGKVDNPKSPLLASAAPPSMASPSPASREDDPLLNPENYTKTPFEDKVANKLKAKLAKSGDTSTLDAATAAVSTPPIGSTKLVNADVKPSRSGPATDVSVASKSMSTPTKSPVSTLPPPPPPTLWQPGVASPAVPPASAKPEPPTIRLIPQPAAPSQPAQGPTTRNVTAPMPAQASRTPAMAPPPPVPTGAGSTLPPYIRAAAIADSDNSGNAFSTPPPATKTSSPSAPPPPPAIPKMPGFDGAAVPNYRSRIPDPPALIAAAPSTSVVAAGFPVAPPSMKTSPVLPEPASAAESGLASRDLVMTLKGSLYPSQREWAADRLSSLDWRSQPEIVDGLVAGARTDPAPMVRIGCLRALGRMHANCEAALSLARDLRNDPDTRIREAAEQTLAALQKTRPVRATD